MSDVFFSGFFFAAQLFLRGRLWQQFFRGLLWQEEGRLPAHCAASKDVADQLTSPLAVLTASPFAAGAQVQCRLLAACIRGAVDGLTSTPFLYYKG